MEHISETPNKDQGLGWKWLFGSGIGALIGVLIAKELFPNVLLHGYINTRLEFGPYLIGIALAVGIPFATVQWVILRFFAKYRKDTKTSILIIWIPVTSVGIALVIFLLYITAAVIDDAFTFYFASPVIVPVAVMPGLIFLGQGQWFILCRLIEVKSYWGTRTLFGGWAGALLGGLWSLAGDWFGAVAGQAMGWFMFGIVLGAFQEKALVTDLDADFK